LIPRLVATLLLGLVLTRAPSAAFACGTEGTPAASPAATPHDAATGSGESEGARVNLETGEALRWPGVDTEFDGVVVRAFLRILDTESEGYRMADDHRFVFPDPSEGTRATPDATLPGRDGYAAGDTSREHHQG